MERVIIGINAKEYDEVCKTLAYTQQQVSQLKPDFEAQNVPFNFVFIRDLLTGGQKIEKFLYDRLERDLQKFETPELRKQQKTSVEESFWQFLNKIREAVKSKEGMSAISPYLAPHEAAKYFDNFTFDKNGEFKLLKGWRERIKEKFVIYADENQLKLIDLGERITDLLNDFRENWTATKQIPLEAVFTETGGKFVFNKDCESKAIAHVLAERNRNRARES